MNGLRRLYWGETTIDFTGRARVWLSISAVLILASIGALVFKGLNLSLEFTGGTAWVVEAEDFTPADAEAAIANQDLGEVSIQAVGSGAVRIEATEVTPEKAQTVEDELVKAADVGADKVSTQSVGPSWGGEVSSKAIRALVIFLLLCVAYISLRFEFKMAAIAIAEMAHDVLIVIGVYAIFGFTVSPATVIAILTMLGYSLYDAVVVFDKVRENAPLLATGRSTYSDVVNLSMNQVMARSLATSITALIPAVCLLVIGSTLLGEGTLRDLSLALVVGIASGTFSSVFFASPLLAGWKEREPRYEQRPRASQQQRKPARPASAPAAATAEEPATEAATAAVGAAASPGRTARAASGGGAKRRPSSRKHGRPGGGSRKKR